MDFKLGHYPMKQSLDFHFDLFIEALNHIQRNGHRRRASAWNVGIRRAGGETETRRLLANAETIPEIRSFQSAHVFEMDEVVVVRSHEETKPRI